MKTEQIPEFGLLHGYRVVLIGLSVAAPFAAELYAENGADVIWIENPKVPDMGRFAQHGASTQQDRRNMRSLALNYMKGEGREAFLELIETADVLIEGSVGGKFEKIGLGDDVLWERNPGLVIAHISGFGQTGDPSYVKRASYDPIAQAFSGAMRMQGVPGELSTPAMPFPGDFTAAFYAFGMTLAALLKRNETGKGESFDIAQFEAMMRLQSQYPHMYFGHGEDYVKEGAHSLICALYGTYRCADGKEVYVLFLGPGVVKAGLPLIGLEAGSELFPEGMGIIPYGSEAGNVAEEAFAKFLSQHTAAEVEDILANGGVPCSQIMDYETIATNSQYQARKVIQEWTASDGVTKVPGVKVVPETKNYPGRVWRGAPACGQDTDDILLELGLSAEQIASMHELGLVNTMDYEHSFAR
ncbi:MAG: CoA transferase [Coriobacteriales bacterium]